VRKQVFCVDNLLSGTRFMFGDGKKVTNMRRTDGELGSRPQDIKQIQAIHRHE
jgi:hypothetical protein